MSSIYLAIKLGSTTTTIYRQGDGLVLREPSLIAVSGSGLKNKEIKAIGYEAANMIGRTVSGTNVVSPIVDGVVNNQELTTILLRGFLRKVCPDRMFKPNIRALVCVPLGISSADKKTFEKVCYTAGITDVTLIPAIICNAAGLDLDLESKYANLIINIGGGCSNIAVIAQNSIVSGISIGIGGSKISTAIEKFISEKYNLEISHATATKIRKEVASLLPSYYSTIEIEGISSSTKQSKLITITSDEIYGIMDFYFNQICTAINTVINDCPPDIVNDIAKNGAYIGGSQINYPGAEKYFRSKLGIPIHLIDIEKNDIFGAGKLLDDPLMLKKIILAN